MATVDVTVVVAMVVTVIAGLAFVYAVAAELLDTRIEAVVDVTPDAVVDVSVASAVNFVVPDFVDTTDRHDCGFV